MNWVKKHKIKSTLIGIFGVFVLLAVIGAANSSNYDKQHPKVAKQVQVTATKPTQAPTKATQPQPAAKMYSYETLKQWDLPNGEGHGKVIVISKDYLNDTDMRALGNKLKDESNNDKKMYVYVFTDKKAAELRDQVVDPNNTLNKADNDLYDANYAADYQKNSYTNYMKYRYRLAGINGEEKSVDY